MYIYINLYNIQTILNPAHYTMVCKYLIIKGIHNDGRLKVDKKTGKMQEIIFTYYSIIKSDLHWCCVCEV